MSGLPDSPTAESDQQQDGADMKNNPPSPVWFKDPIIVHSGYLYHETQSQAKNECEDWGIGMLERKRGGVSVVSLHQLSFTVVSDYWIWYTMFTSRVKII